MNETKERTVNINPKASCPACGNFFQTGETVEWYAVFEPTQMYPDGWDDVTTFAVRHPKC